MITRACGSWRFAWLASGSCLVAIGGLALKKTKKMIAVEEKFKRPLEEFLPEMMTEHGLSNTADILGVSKATLGYWLLKMGINMRRVALRPGETMRIERSLASDEVPLREVLRHDCRD